MSSLYQALGSVDSQLSQIKLAIAQEEDEVKSLRDTLAQVKLQNATFTQNVMKIQLEVQIGESKAAGAKVTKSSLENEVEELNLSLNELRERQGHVKQQLDRLNNYRIQKRKDYQELRAQFKEKYRQTFAEYNGIPENEEDLSRCASPEEFSDLIAEVEPTPTPMTPAPIPTPTPIPTSMRIPIPATIPTPTPIQTPTPTPIPTSTPTPTPTPKSDDISLMPPPSLPAPKSLVKQRGDSANLDIFGGSSMGLNLFGESSDINTQSPGTDSVFNFFQNSGGSLF